MEPVRSDQIVGLWSYLQIIDWSEKWLWVLITFHILCALTTYFTRRGGPAQTFYFVALLTLVYFAETLNEIAAKNWRKFSRQQYFDSGGLFISVVYSVPLLINCLVMLILWLLSTGTMMVRVKKMKLKQEYKARQRVEGLMREEGVTNVEGAARMEGANEHEKNE